jgi:hypothetical protein
MSEAPNIDAGPAGNPTHDALALAPAQVASLREQWVAAGLDAAAFDTAATTDARAPAPTDPSKPEPPKVTTSGLSQDQAQEFAEALRASGIPEDKIAEALKADGFDVLEPDTRSDEEKEFDQTFGGAEPHEFQIDYVGRVDANADPVEAVKFNTEATTWLSEAGFPANIGPGVIERTMDVNSILSRMSAGEKDIWAMEQKAELERQAGGPEAADQVMNYASLVLRRGDPKFAERLFYSGAAMDAFLLMFLGHQGKRLAVRAGAA